MNGKSRPHLHYLRPQGEYKFVCARWRSEAAAVRHGTAPPACLPAWRSVPYQSGVICGGAAVRGPRRAGDLITRLPRAARQISAAEHRAQRRGGDPITPSKQPHSHGISTRWNALTSCEVPCSLETSWLIGFTNFSWWISAYHQFPS